VSIHIAGHLYLKATCHFCNMLPVISSDLYFKFGVKKIEMPILGCL
jgi:hypothetical protein